MNEVVEIYARIGNDTGASAAATATAAAAAAAASADGAEEGGDSSLFQRFERELWAANSIWFGLLGF